MARKKHPTKKAARNGCTWLKLTDVSADHNLPGFVPIPAALTTITTNEIGLDVRDYDQPITRSGSVQSVDVSDIKNMGLDFTKSYIQVWTETPVNAVERDRSGDQIIWNGRRFEIQGETDWNAVDGWNSFTAVEVPTP